jgi:hypothetical protein
MPLNPFSTGHWEIAPCPQPRPHSWYPCLAPRYWAYTLRNRVIRVHRQRQASRRRYRSSRARRGGCCCCLGVRNQSGLGGLARPCHCRGRGHIRRRVAKWRKPRGRGRSLLRCLVSARRAGSRGCGSRLRRRRRWLM